MNILDIYRINIMKNSHRQIHNIAPYYEENYLYPSQNQHAILPSKVKITSDKITIF